ncbi:hypothetical protein GU926_13545 [Nibribacter ruber]|uniref:Uncharacterized protein n=1 Tax=Nibribacter ruber TaxID=2698458 RepID=A0A6P1P1D1_9BACT|nr:hypothetical protein [Nibribacter ruber]QHL88401.1 hypothetical protein GU926_13545 [Nibribacter ruber]
MNNYQRPTRPERSKTSSAMKYASMFMALVYIAVGLYVIFSSSGQMSLPQNYKYIIGGMLFLYGLIRFVRSYQQYYKKNRRDEEVE